jgi:hypothetical protein
MDSKLAVPAAAMAAVASAGMVAGAPAPAVAADQVQSLTYGVGDAVSGYVQAYAGIGSTTEFFEGTSKWTGGTTEIGGAGRLNWWLNPGMALQVDAYGSGVQKADSSRGTSAGIAAHLAWHGMGNVAGMGNLALALMGSAGTANGNRFHNLAVEAMVHAANWAIYGQAGMTNAMSSSSTPSAGYLALQGRFFFNQNFMASVDGTFGGHPGFDGTYHRIGAQLDLKPTNMPLAFFLRGQMATFAEDDFRQTTTEIKFGAKLFVNQPTLWSNSLRGATWVDWNPTFGEFANKFF